MAQRLTLTRKVELITEALKHIGISNVYFEPPQSIKLKYPCAVFKRGVISSRHAGNIIYKIDDSFDLTYIRLDPDDDMTHDILNIFRQIRHTRTFVADGLHHDQYKLYYNQKENTYDSNQMG